MNAAFSALVHDGQSGGWIRRLELQRLVRPADDQLLNAVVEWRSSLSTPRVGPGARDEAAVPAQQRLRLDEEARPATTRQCPADRREQGAVSGLEPGTCEWASEKVKRRRHTTVPRLANQQLRRHI